MSIANGIVIGEVRLGSSVVRNDTLTSDYIHGPDVFPITDYSEWASLFITFTPDD